MNSIERAVAKLSQGQKHSERGYESSPDMNAEITSVIDRFMDRVESTDEAISGDESRTPVSHGDRKLPVKRATYRILMMFLPLVVLAGGVFAALSIMNQRHSPPGQTVKIDPPLVEVQKAEPTTVRLKVKSQGTVIPRTEIDLVSQVDGQVFKVAPAFAAGGFFKQKEILVVIQPLDYDLAITKAKAKVAEARQELIKEQAEAEQARSEWDALGEGEPTPLALREPQLAAARAKLAAAGAELAEAQLKRQRTELKAPFDGRVKEKLVDVGQYVTAGTKVSRVFSVDVAEISLPLYDAQLAYIHLPLAYQDMGQHAAVLPKVTLRATVVGKRHEWQGHIVRTEGTIDKKTQMLYVVAQVKDPYGYRENSGSPPLAVGLFVEAEIEGREFENVFVLPKQAMRAHNRVWIIDKESRLRFREVDILRTEPERVIVRGGLNKEDKVVVSAVLDATDGMHVRVSESRTSAQGPMQLPSS